MSTGLLYPEDPGHDLCILDRACIRKGYGRFNEIVLQSNLDRFTAYNLESRLEDNKQDIVAWVDRCPTGVDPRADCSEIMALVKSEVSNVDFAISNGIVEYGDRVSRKTDRKFPHVLLITGCPAASRTLDAAIRTRNTELGENAMMIATTKDDVHLFVTHRN